MTTIAALQVVERGMFALDDDIARTLPELAELEIFTGSGGDGKPVLKSREKTIISQYSHLLLGSPIPPFRLLLGISLYTPLSVAMIA